MPYIHELDDWPSLTWDERSLSPLLVAVRHRQGRLLGRMESLGFDLRSEATLLAVTSDVVKSSEIEGEDLDSQEVRSSVAGRLGLDAAGLPVPGRRVEGVVEMMLDATQHAEQPLTADRLHAWHASLFPTGRSGMVAITVGAWRGAEGGPMQVVSGPMGRERVHFEAPRADRLAHEMDQFLQWFNSPSPLDPVLKAGVAHLWFVTIHPYDDGNGRIARAIADLALARADQTSERFYSMSTRIAAERRDYYSQLESAQRGSLDITAWLAWFLGCLDRAFDHADTMLDTVLRKARIWQRLNERPVNARQRLIINRMLDGWRGHLNTREYAKIAKCSTDTALRDIKDLLARGVLVKNSASGRSTSYRLADPSDGW